MLTKNNVLLADQKSGHIKAEVPLGDVTKVSMSSQNDGFFAVHLKEVEFKSVINYQANLYCMRRNYFKTLILVLLACKVKKAV